MLLLFNKTIKPLNQFAKKNPKEVTVFFIFDKIFSQFFSYSVTHKFLRTLVLCKVSEKGKTHFGFIHTGNRQK